MMQKYKTNENTQKTTDIFFKNTNKLYNLFFAFFFCFLFFLFCCITPGLIWRRPPEAAIDSGNADRHPTLRSRYRYPLYELLMHLPRAVQDDFYTAWMDARQGVFIALKYQNDMKINLHLLPDGFFCLFVFFCILVICFIHENAVNHASWRSVFKSTVY